jgi:hypothetical protein
VNAAMNLWVKYNAGNFLTSYKPVSFSTKTLLRGVSKEYTKLYPGPINMGSGCDIQFIQYLY